LRCSGFSKHPPAETKKEALKVSVDSSSSLSTRQWVEAILDGRDRTETTRARIRGEKATGKGTAHKAVEAFKRELGSASSQV